LGPGLTSVAVPPSLAIAQVTPHPVGSGTEVDRYVTRAAKELAARGHRVLLVGPSADQRAVRETRAALRKDASLFSDDGAPRLLAVGEVLTGLTASRRAALPIDVARAVERLHAVAALDVCHVHDPFAPSVPSAALRHSRALNVGSFHLPAERLVSTQVARKVVELVFGRLDARTATWGATADLLERFFPSLYRCVPPGVDRGAHVAGDGTVRNRFVDNFDGADFVECEVTSAVDNAHAADADPIQNLVLVPDDHSGLKFVRILQTGLIRGTHVEISGIRLVTCRAEFH